jgi:hypothetical protein
METRDEARKELENHESWEDVPTDKREKLVDWLFEGPGRALHLDTVNLRDTPAHEKALETFEYALFDEMAWLVEGFAECHYCDRTITHRRPPPASDDLGWRRVGDEHTKKCVATRAGTIEAPKKAKKVKTTQPSLTTFKLMPGPLRP